MPPAAFSLGPELVPGNDKEDCFHDQYDNENASSFGLGYLFAWVGFGVLLTQLKKEYPEIKLAG